MSTVQNHLSDINPFGDFFASLALAAGTQAAAKARSAAVAIGQIRILGAEFAYQLVGGEYRVTRGRGSRASEIRLSASPDSNGRLRVLSSANAPASLGWLDFFLDVNGALCVGRVK